MNDVSIDLPVGFVFPGQGTQRSGMGSPWRDTDAWSIVAELSEWTGHDVEALLLHTEDAQLQRTDLAQIAIFALEIVTWIELRNRLDIEVRAFAGHSLGEYVALVAAGALALRDAGVLVAERGAAMRAAAQLTPGTMGTLVGATEAEAAELAHDVRAAGQDVWIANVNAPQQVALSGTSAGIEAAAELAGARGYKLVRIPVGGAFHSPLMAAAADQLGAALRAAPFAGRHATVVANVDAMAYHGDCDWPELERRQLTAPVLWAKSVDRLVTDLGCRSLCELGPRRVLTGLTRRITPETRVVSVGHPDDLNQLLANDAAQPRRRNNHVHSGNHARS